jgi:hypothetical protein
MLFAMQRLATVAEAGRLGIDAPEAFSSFGIHCSHP